MSTIKKSYLYNHDDRPNIPVILEKEANFKAPWTIGKLLYTMIIIAPVMGTIIFVSQSGPAIEVVLFTSFILAIVSWLFLRLLNPFHEGSILHQPDSDLIKGQKFKNIPGYTDVLEMRRDIKKFNHLIQPQGEFSLIGIEFPTCLMGICEIDTITEDTSIQLLKKVYEERMFELSYMKLICGSTAWKRLAGKTNAIVFRDKVHETMVALQIISKKYFETPEISEFEKLARKFMASLELATPVEPDGSRKSLLWERLFPQKKVST